MADSLEPETTPAEFVPSRQAYRQTLLGRLDERWLNRPAVRRALLVLLIVILVVPSVQFVIRIQESDPSPFRPGGERRRTALGRWLPTAKLLAEPQPDEHPYGFGHWFPLPPMVLMSLVPLSKLGYVKAAAVWAVLKVGGLLAALAWLVRCLGRRDFSVPTGVLVMTGVFALRPIVADIQHGNVNIFMLIWLALAWSAYVRGRDVWAGLLLSLAIVTKLTPALALVYFAYKREWRVCLASLVGLLLVFVIIPGCYLGFIDNLELLRAWFEMLVAPFALHGYAASETANQSLYGVILRIGMLSGLLPVESMPIEQAKIAGMLGMIRPAGAWRFIVRPLVSLGLLAALAWGCRARISNRQDPRRWLEFALVLLAMLLMSERTWKHHGTTLAIVFLAVWYALACLPWPQRFRSGFVAGLAAQWFLLVGTSGGFLGHTAAEVLLAAGAFCWGVVLCFVQILNMLAAWPKERPDASAPAST